MNTDRELDNALHRAMARPAGAEDAAAGRVLARLDATPLPPQKRRLLAAWWPEALIDLNFTPAWPRVAALACAAVLGITIGLSSFGARIATGLDLVRVASMDDSTVNIFDSDSVTGLRP